MFLAPSPSNCYIPSHTQSLSGITVNGSVLNSLFQLQVARKRGCKSEEPPVARKRSCKSEGSQLPGKGVARVRRWTMGYHLKLPNAVGPELMALF